MSPALDALWYSAVLAFATAAAWLLAAGTRPLVRRYLRLAAACNISLAISTAFAIAPIAVAAIATTLTAAFLALAAYASFRRPARPAATAFVLIGAGLAGIGSAFGGAVLPAVVTQLFSILFLLIVSRRGLMRLRAPSLQLAAGGLALFGASCALVLQDKKASMAVVLFSAAGLLGCSLAVARISDTFVKRRRRPPRTNETERLR